MGSPRGLELAEISSRFGLRGMRTLYQAPAERSRISGLVRKYYAEDAAGDILKRTGNGNPAKVPPNGRTLQRFVPGMQRSAGRAGGESTSESRWECHSGLVHLGPPCETTAHPFYCLFNAQVDIGGTRVLYTGDYSREEDRHLKAAEVPELSPDVCVIESTYGVQSHQPRRERETRFTEVRALSSTRLLGGSGSGHLVMKRISLQACAAAVQPLLQRQRQTTTSAEDIALAPR